MNKKRMNSDNKNKAQQKHCLGTVSSKLLGGLNRFYICTALTVGSAVVLKLFGPCEGLKTVISPIHFHQWRSRLRFVEMYQLKYL